MVARLLMLCLALALSACATPAAAPEPREMTLVVAPERVLEEGLAMLVERGYVIRYADADLGRVDAQLATWPGYRLRLEALEQAGRTRVVMRGWRGSRPLAPHRLDPLLVELEARLGTRAVMPP